MYSILLSSELLRNWNVDLSALCEMVSADSAKLWPKLLTSQEFVTTVDYEQIGEQTSYVGCLRRLMLLYLHLCTEITFL